jgi:hypothetical protein
MNTDRGVLRKDAPLYFSGETCTWTNIVCGYEVPGIIFLPASYLYTHSLLRGVTFKILPLSGYALSLTMLSMLEIFLELMLWESHDSSVGIALAYGLDDRGYRV